jgi:cellulose synthase/poly-beta-1,6-N-acetylglucosamine synthase-like glycosyltransferase
MFLMTEVLFWVCLGLVVYVYLGYPSLIWLCASICGSKQEGQKAESSDQPRVSILVAALNEEESIGQRIENALAQDYPPERLEIVIASDGSVDGTNQIVQRFVDRNPGRVRLVAFPVRRGKANVLNDAIRQVSSEIVVLSDANTFFQPLAVGRLARWFGDPGVSAVCGKLVLIDHGSGRNVDSLYWRYETFLKTCEGRLGALLGSNGAIYAIRRNEYLPIPGDTIIDDFVIPLKIKQQKGGRIVYDASAVATEETPANVSDEFRRRARIGAGGFQSIARLWRLLLPIYGWTSLAFLSHKVLRWFCPAFLLLALAANLFLLAEPIYRFLLVGQIMFYLLAGLGNLVPGNGSAIRLLRLATLFTSMNLALAVGFWRWLTGQQRGTWQRTSR